MSRKNHYISGPINISKIAVPNAALPKVVISPNIEGKSKSVCTKPIKKILSNNEVNVSDPSGLSVRPTYNLAAIPAKQNSSDHLKKQVRNFDFPLQKRSLTTVGTNDQAKRMKLSPAVANNLDKCKIIKMNNLVIKPKSSVTPKLEVEKRGRYLIIPKNKLEFSRPTVTKPKDLAGKTENENDGNTSLYSVNFEPINEVIIETEPDKMADKVLENHLNSNDQGTQTSVYSCLYKNNKMYVIDGDNEVTQIPLEAPANVTRPCSQRSIGTDTSDLNNGSSNIELTRPKLTSQSTQVDLQPSRIIQHDKCTGVNEDSLFVALGLNVNSDQQSAISQSNQKDSCQFESATSTLQSHDNVITTQTDDLNEPYFSQLPSVNQHDHSSSVTLSQLHRNVILPTETNDFNQPEYNRSQIVSQDGSSFPAVLPDLSTTLELSNLSGADSEFSLSFDTNILSPVASLNCHFPNTVNSDLKRNQSVQKLIQKMRNDIKCCLELTDGNMPIHLAALRQDWKKLKCQCIILKSIKSHVNHLNSEKQTPLLLAVMGHEYGSPDVNEGVTILLKARASLSIVDSQGCSPLHLAVSNCNANLVDKLLEADHVEDVINTANYDGFTPLHLAAINNSPEIIEKLCSEGANINVKDRKSGKTAYFIACEKGYEEAVEMLIKFGANTTLTNFAMQPPPSTVYKQSARLDVPRRKSYQRTISFNEEREDPVTSNIPAESNGLKNKQVKRKRRKSSSTCEPVSSWQNEEDNLIFSTEQNAQALSTNEDNNVILANGQNLYSTVQNSQALSANEENNVILANDQNLYLTVQNSQALSNNEENSVILANDQNLYSTVQNSQALSANEDNSVILANDQNLYSTVQNSQVLSTNEENNVLFTNDSNSYSNIQNNPVLYTTNEDTSIAFYHDLGDCPDYNNYIEPLRENNFIGS